MVHSGVFEFSPPSWDTSTTLDALMWNGAVGELSSCVINHNLMYYNIRNTFGTNLPIDFLSLFVVCTYIYVSYVL